MRLLKCARFRLLCDVECQCWAVCWCVLSSSGISHALFSLILFFSLVASRDFLGNVNLRLVIFESIDFPVTKIVQCYFSYVYGVASQFAFDTMALLTGFWQIEQTVICGCIDDVIHVVYALKERIH